MPITIQMSVTGIPMVNLKINNLYKYLQGKGKADIALDGFNAAGKVFDRNFTTEGGTSGLGAWESLNEATVHNRERLGFPGERPILRRYGDLRQASAWSLMDARGSTSFEFTDGDGKTVMVNLNMNSTGGVAQMGGDKAWNQIETIWAPARPYWFTTKPVTQAVRRAAVVNIAQFIAESL